MDRKDLNSIIKYKLPIKLVFSHYHKYTFYYTNRDDPNMKVDAWYGGDADMIYRHTVDNNEYITITDIDDFERQFTGVQIHNYTNECIYSWEDD